MTTTSTLTSQLPNADHQWRSPLKKIHMMTGAQVNTAKRKLFDTAETPEKTETEISFELREKKENGNVKQELNYTLLSKIYNYDFDKPSTEANATQFFAIREQVFAIETFLAQSKESTNHPDIRNLVIQWLKCPHYEKKMSELGLLLFYLDKDGALPEAKSLLEYRANEIKNNAEEYIKAHAKAQACPTVASGKTHYLMRAFAHMLFIRDPLTQAQTYNKGGLISVKELLLQPSLEISRFLQPEHREHILIIVDQILNHTGMENFFKQKLSVHPDLQDAVRLNLKLTPGSAIPSCYVFYDCMMALFSDIRQLESPNCYAVSALIYATENHTYKVLVHLVKWLTEGYFVFNGTTAFPIQPLVEKRLVYSEDLNVTLEGSKAFTLSTLGNLSEILALDKKNQKSGAQPISSILAELLQVNNASNLKNNAEKYYSSYKHNTLIHLMLAVLETGFINSERTGYSKLKKGLIDVCLKEFESIPKHLLPNATLFLSRLKAKLENRLWLENCRENKIVLDRDKKNLTVGSHTISQFKGDLLALAEVFEKGQRIFCLLSGKYVPLFSYTELQEVVVAAIAEVKQELEKEGKTQEASAAEKFTKAAQHWDFRKNVSFYASKQIDKKQILGKDLNQSNLLLFKETGGDMDITLEVAFGIKVVTHNLVGCSTPYRFLDKLMTKVKEFDQELFNNSRRVIIAAAEHAWTLSPTCWKILLENQNDLQSFIQKNIFDVAKKRLSTTVTPELVESVIQSYTQVNSTRNKMRSAFKNYKNLTFNKFKERLLERVANPQNVDHMRQVIETEFSKVKVRKQDFESILKQLSCLPEESALLDSWYKKMPNEPIQPYQLALRLRALLLEEKVAIVQPYDIEKVICKVLQFPLPIQVGDLNWVDTYREDSEHRHLMINFSWELGVPAYFQRFPNFQTMQHGRDFDWIQIQHPQNLIAKHQ